MGTGLRNRATDGVLIAVTAVATVIVQIPTIGTSGYKNLGDAVIIACALLFGGARGALIGGIGSAIADLYGHPQYAPATLLIKGLEGYACGLLGRDLNRSGGFLLRLGGAIIGAALMVIGYFGYNSLLLGKAAFVDIPGNMIQGGLGVLVGLILHRALRRFS